MDIRFLSSNAHKIREVETILHPRGIRVISSPAKIEEIQTENSQVLVRDKVLKAFKKIGKPVFVEHTGLYLRGLNDLPGGLTQIFWDRLGPDRFVSLVNNLNTREITAKTIIGYCDSRKVFVFEGEVAGHVAETPAGNTDFQWDCVFIPDGYSQTFAELGDVKNDISMRRIALNKLSQFLTQR